jgi:hypothetical protein
MSRLYRLSEANTVQNSTNATRIVATARFGSRKMASRPEGARLESAIRIKRV